MNDGDGLTLEELEAERGEQLPEREAMSLVDLGEPGTFTAAPDGPPTIVDDAEGIPTHEVHNPSRPPL